MILSELALFWLLADAIALHTFRKIERKIKYLNLASFRYKHCFILEGLLKPEGDQSNINSWFWKYQISIASCGSKGYHAQINIGFPKAPVHGTYKQDKLEMTVVVW